MKQKIIYNPFLPLNTYIPDGEPHVFGDRLYLYGSHDAEGGDYFCMLDYECWSAPVDDLTDWRCEGTIYRASQCPHYSETRQDLYAPDVVCGSDGRYYLYYDLSGRGTHGFDGPISVAVCDTPAGQYEYYGDVRYPDGRPLDRFIPFDPAILNDNGRYYLSYGWGLGMDTHAPGMEDFSLQIMTNLFSKTEAEILSEEPLSILGANVVELCSDMLTVKSEPKRILPALNNAPEDSLLRKHSFYEAASLRKFGNYYYFIYSSSLGHELCYATSKYPDHDFTYRGTIISNGDVGYHDRSESDRLCATGTNHGSIECIQGNYYIFYHRLTHNTAFSRQACAEHISISDDGTIEQVEMTSQGLNATALPAIGSYSATICCNLTNGHMPHLSNLGGNPDAPNITHDSNEHFITQITDNTMIGYKYFQFDDATELSLVYRGSGGTYKILADETFLGEIVVHPCETWCLSAPLMLPISAEHALYLIYSGTGYSELKEIRFNNSTNQLQEVLS